MFTAVFFVLLFHVECLALMSLAIMTCLCVSSSESITEIRIWVCGHLYTAERRSSLFPTSVCTKVFSIKVVFIVT